MATTLRRPSERACLSRKEHANTADKSEPCDRSAQVQCRESGHSSASTWAEALSLLPSLLQCVPRLASCHGALQGTPKGFGYGHVEMPHACRGPMAESGRQICCKWVGNKEMRACVGGVARSSGMRDAPARQQTIAPGSMSTAAYDERRKRASVLRTVSSERGDHFPLRTIPLIQLPRR